MTAPTAAMLRAETIGDIVKRLRAAGQVMKESKGRADNQIVREILVKKLK